ncbi:hypothetical protein ACR3IL_10855 [Streptococcus iniae]|uniref:Uncharacterized protein n=3 Tax=root TaxID=1 RepID=A0ABU0A7D4_STRDY|nr:hypothetical protein [Streptococcus dysgalactiae]QQC55479.1 hypothetical protein I6H73_00205 [Streptococcus dysgalactiae]SUN69979.1 Uncharacterised protein [Streptococcus dysgalactiae]HEP2841416.1 hypothetical protein [Streptococcus pyogenes]
MGGRGASSGMSDKGDKYGTEYSTIHKVGNIKFVTQNGKGSQRTPKETMTKNRVYALIDRNKNKPKSIIYFDGSNKRRKQVDLDHKHKEMQPHTHHGYNHNEYDVGKKGGTRLTTKEKKMVERVMKEWYNYNKKRKE